MRPDGGSAVVRRDADSGFTLVETLVAMMIFSIVAVMAVWGLRTYQHAQEASGSAHDLISGMRNVAERAQSEGRTYCVAFASGGATWDVWRYSCDPSYTSPTSPTPVRVLSNQKLQGSSLVSVASAFQNVQQCPAGLLACVYFYPRGTASSGSFQVSLGSRAYTIDVEGLTGRVYLG